MWWDFASVSPAIPLSIAAGRRGPPLSVEALVVISKRTVSTMEGLQIGPERLNLPPMLFDSFVMCRPVDWISAPFNQEALCDEVCDLPV